MTQLTLYESRLAELTGATDPQDASTESRSDTVKGEADKWAKKLVGMLPFGGAATTLLEARDTAVKMLGTEDQIDEKKVAQSQNQYYVDALRECIRGVNGIDDRFLYVIHANIQSKSDLQKYRLAYGVYFLYGKNCFRFWTTDESWRPSSGVFLMVNHSKYSKELKTSAAHAY